MTYAVQAVQKVAGIDRNGRIGPTERDFLESFQYPQPLHVGAEPNRTEIDIAKQVITLYNNNQVTLITTTSTASGETFCYVTPKKAPTQRICEVATTPNGRYQYYFFYDGWQDGDLGELYNPYYFFKGRAIHGYDSVPVTPASHGCSRIPMHIATYWHTLVHRRRTRLRRRWAGQRRRDHQQPSDLGRVPARARMLRPWPSCRRWWAGVRSSKALGGTTVRCSSPTCTRTRCCA